MYAGILSFIYSFWCTLLDVIQYWRDVRTPFIPLPHPAPRMHPPLPINKLNPLS